MRAMIETVHLRQNVKWTVFRNTPFDVSFLQKALSLGDVQARERHININFFVQLVLGRPRVCPGDFTGFVPETNPVKTWDKPGLSPYFTQWKPGKPGFVPGKNPVCPWDNPGDEGRHRKFM